MRRARQLGLASLSLLLCLASEAQGLSQDEAPTVDSPPGVALLEEAPSPKASQPLSWPGMHEADPSLLNRAYRESGASRDAEGTGWASYPTFLIGRLVEAFAEFLGRGVKRLTKIPRLPSIFGMILLFAAVAALLWWLIRFLLQRRSAPVRPTTTRNVDQPTVTEKERDTGAWRRELERLLAAGKSSEALQALWWWLATRLQGNHVDPAWTSRELLVEAGRQDLSTVVRRLDLLLYGPGRPETEEVRTLWGDLEGALA